MVCFIEDTLKPVSLTVDNAYIVESVKIHAGVTIAGQVLAAVKEILSKQGKSFPTPKECSHAYVEYLSTKANKSEFISDNSYELVIREFSRLKSVEMAESGATLDLDCDIEDSIRDSSFDDMLLYVMTHEH